MNQPDVLCFSHVRWTSAPERPSQLMSRCARRQRVFFIEEPVIDATYTEITKVAPNLWRVVPHLGEGKSERELLSLWRGQLALLHAEHRIVRPILWYYSPAAVLASTHLYRSLTVYDCTFDVEAHQKAFPQLADWEKELLGHVDLMLVADPKLFEAKRSALPNVHHVPNGIDVELFRRARKAGPIPRDQAGVAGPRIGYYGRLDGRIDWKLVTEVAELRPKWQFVFVGPKAAGFDLPQRANLHYLGPKAYDELPHYVADWDAAMAPFACDEPGRADPDKTLEFLAAGKPVVATPLPELVEPYARMGLVQVAEEAESFVQALGAALRKESTVSEAERDTYLAHRSWEGVFQRIRALVVAGLAGEQPPPRSPKAPRDRAQPVQP